jgi:RimJ/RimL family protein N-acetyltransferase
VTPASSGFIFDTERFHVRPLTAEYEAIYCFLYTDAETMRFIGAPLSPERAQRSFKKAVELAGRSPPIVQLFLAIIDKATRLPVGVCSIASFDQSRRAAEVGIMLKPEAQGLGIAREALSSLVDRAFSELPIDRVWAQIPQTHETAAKMLVKLGFSPAGNRVADIDARDRSIWVAVRDEWRSSPRTAG